MASGESAFLDASATGSDIFFLTAGKLVEGDVDTAIDVYDAHECINASPCFGSSSEETPVCESAASCRVSPAPQPSIYGAPSSATFSGQGNVIPVAPEASVKPKSLTRAQKLAKALEACKKTKSRRKRAACERAARKRYGPVSKKSKRGRKSRRSGGVA